MSGPEIDLPHGTQVLLRTPLGLHPAGAAGIILDGGATWYTVGFPDGSAASVQRDALTILRLHQKEVFHPDTRYERYQDRIAYLAVTGSQAYGLATDTSDLDQRGFYVARTSDLLSLRGVPDTLKGPGDITIWELRHFLQMALNANPNVLETAFSPEVTSITPVGSLIVEGRSAVLSRRVYMTYQGYAMSQFKKLERDLRSKGEIRWKHAMHLLRLLLSGGHMLTTGVPLIEVSAHWRAILLDVRAGTMPWEEVDRLRRQLQTGFELAYSSSPLPHDPDYSWANALLLQARQMTLTEEAELLAPSLAPEPDIR